jgi:hypothetical protein
MREAAFEMLRLALAVSAHTEALTILRISSRRRSNCSGVSPS